MPIFEFRCSECGRESELLVRTARANEAACPHCGGQSLEKQFSVFAASGASPDPEPACSGNPSQCGRCGPL